MRKYYTNSISVYFLFFLLLTPFSFGFYDFLGVGNSWISINFTSVGNDSINYTTSLGYVPYTGANKNVDLGIYNLTTTKVSTDLLKYEKDFFVVLDQNKESSMFISKNLSTCLGWRCLNSSTGLYNTCVGDQCNTGKIMTDHNAGLGYRVLYRGTGSYHTAIGSNALAGTTGIGSTGVGFNAVAYTSGNYNTGVGYNAMGGGTTGSGNFAMGNQAGARASSGSNNVMIGNDAGRNRLAGNGNVFIGRSSGRYHTDKSNNVFIGSYSGERYNLTSETLIIHSSNEYTSDPLIFGSFSDRFLRISGILNVTKNLEVKGNATYNSYYGGMYFYNESGVSFVINDTYQVVSLYDESPNSNGFVYHSGTGKLQLGDDGGVYQVIWDASGTGKQNNLYLGKVFVNEVGQDNTVSRVYGEANDLVKMTGLGFIDIQKGDNVTLRIRDVGSTSNGIVYATNLNLVRVGG